MQMTRFLMMISSIIRIFHCEKLQIEIRYAQERDFPQVARLVSELRRMHIALRPDLYKIPEQSLTKDEFIDGLKKQTILVAESEKEVVAVLRYYKKNVSSANKKSYIERNVLFVNTLIVDEKYQHKKIATQLLNKLKTEARKNEVDAIELKVSQENPNALTFYEKNDFKCKEIRLEYILATKQEEK